MTESGVVFFPVRVTRCCHMPAALYMRASPPQYLRLSLQGGDLQRCRCAELRDNLTNLTGRFSSLCCSNFPYPLWWEGRGGSFCLYVKKASLLMATRRKTVVLFEMISWGNVKENNPHIYPGWLFNLPAVRGEADLCRPHPHLWCEKSHLSLLLLSVAHLVWHVSTL